MICFLYISQPIKLYPYTLAYTHLAIYNYKYKYILNGAQIEKIAKMATKSETNKKIKAGTTGEEIVVVAEVEEAIIVAATEWYGDKVEGIIINIDQLTPVT